MFMLVVGILTLISILIVGSARAQAATQDFSTDSGPLHLTLLGHGSVLIEWHNQIIYVDPYSEATSFVGRKKAHQIWITHAHHDHLDLAAIEEIVAPDTLFVSDPGSAQQLSGKVTRLSNGDRAVVGGISISAVPAYNQVRERSPGVKFHPMGMGNGYVADFGGFRLYIAGDTESISEMSGLKEIDVAIVPVMLPYTMSPQEAVQAAQTFLPKVLLPYHCSKDDALQVAQLLANSSIEVRIL